MKGGLATSFLLELLVYPAIDLLWKMRSDLLAFGAWSYSRRMPLVPLLDVGLWPVLQLALLMPLALWAAAHGRTALPAAG